MVLALHMFKVCLNTSASTYGVISHQYLLDNIKNVIDVLFPGEYMAEQDDQEQPTEQNTSGSVQLYQLCVAESLDSHHVNLEEIDIDSDFLYKLCNEPTYVQEIISPRLNF